MKFTFQLVACVGLIWFGFDLVLSWAVKEERRRIKDWHDRCDDLNNKTTGGKESIDNKSLRLSK